MYCHYLGVNIANPKFYSLKVKIKMLFPVRLFETAKDVNNWCQG